MANANDKKIAKKRIYLNSRRINILMAERGWGLAELAFHSGIKAPYLSRIIRNERYVERHVDKIASAFGVSKRRLVLSSEAVEEQTSQAA